MTSTKRGLVAGAAVVVVVVGERGDGGGGGEGVLGPVEAGGDGKGALDVDNAGTANHLPGWKLLSVLLLLLLLLLPELLVSTFKPVTEVNSFFRRCTALS